MENREQLREFLVSRRAKITPEQAKLPAYGGNRRVGGLRREEVAMLAGVSVDYYTKLERGIVGNVSSSVLDAVARALQLKAPEREHLYLLVGTRPSAKPGRQRTPSRGVRPAIQRVLDGMADAPAVVITKSRYLVAANPLGRAIYSPLYDASPDANPNTARFVFLDPGARDYFLDWPNVAADTVANLLTELGRFPADEDLTMLIDTLNRESSQFSDLWRAHDVRYHQPGLKSIHHPIVGDLHLTFEMMDLPADPGQSLLVYGAEPNSTTTESLRLLASWSAELRSEADPRPSAHDDRSR